jgi:hypothetical protein
MRLLAMIALLWAGAAVADLYRWVDPETGSVKYSNIPPPWFGNDEKQRRAPKVERIPERARPAPLQEEAAAARAESVVPVASLTGLEARRKQLMLQLAATVSEPAEFQKLLEEYARLIAQMNEKDPKGAPGRRAEAEAVLGKLVKGASK